MTQLVSKPSGGEVIGRTQEGKEVYVTDLFQTFFDELETQLNQNILGSALIIPETTVANLPDAGDFQSGLINVSNESGGYVTAFSDGTNWRRVTDRTIVS